MGDLLQPWHLIILLTMVGLLSPFFFNVFAIPAFWRIFKNAGFPPALGLLMLLPVVNLIVLYALSFSNRPLLSPCAIAVTSESRNSEPDQPSPFVMVTPSEGSKSRRVWRASSEGVHRLSIGVGIVAAIASFFIIGNAANNADYLLPVLLMSVVTGAVAWGLVRLVDWIAAGFRMGHIGQTGDLKMSRYDPLYKHLSVQKELTVLMTFSEIEEILGRELPPSARKYAAWWANANPETGQHPYSQAWLLAGRQATANLMAERVIFKKIN